MVTPPEPVSPGHAFTAGAPKYPNTEVPPPYPGATPPPPPYPGSIPSPSPPQYPLGSTPSTPGVGAGALGRSGSFSEQAHDPLQQNVVTSGRVHIADRQRGADATAVGQLLLFLPIFVVSLVLVAAASYALFPAAGWAVVLLWLASGALVFHRPTEGVIARYLLNLRYPTPPERSRLEPVWREVTARAGVEGRAYELWVEESDDLNAVAAAGHIVGVTRFSLDHLSSGQLAAVLAHELGHHIGGHTWSLLLGEWYALPGRIAWVAIRKLARFAVLVGSRLNGLVAVILFLATGAFVIAFALSFWFVILAVIAAPYPLAALARKAQLRADQHAAALGFGPMLADVLQMMRAAEPHPAGSVATGFAARGDAISRGENTPRVFHRSGLPDRLLASHPDYHTRLHHLAQYLEPGR
ncbi:MAG: M48 family metalloprotease [Streptomyces sp.]|nr:M48 family metalloprotease [Streptomyces sp.]